MSKFLVDGLKSNRSMILAGAAGLLTSSGLFTVAMAQEAARPQEPADATRAAEEKQNEIVVVGVRASQQGSIERKRRADTVTDSIVAEDITQFPDKNAGEALSRITGVQLTRDFGEGTQVSIRGVEPDLNRVEVNGLTTLGTRGDGNSGADFRELQTELVKSIDVYKGSMADLTEGGVGGTVSITTRKPLDFKRRTISGTISGQSLTTSEEGWSPRVNVLFADKIMDGRLGFMANLTFDNNQTRNDYARNTSWNFLRDWDNSLEKTVTSLNPIASAVTDKSLCAGLTGTSSTGTTNAADCLSQWNDYAPQIARYGIWTRDNERKSLELTGQYRVNKKLDVWASVLRNQQAQVLNDRNFGTDLTAVTRLATAGVAPTFNATTGARSGGTCVPVSTTATPAGMVITNHIVTQYTVGNCLNVNGQGGQGAFTTSSRDFTLDIDSQYVSGGFNYIGDRLKLEFMVADSGSRYSSDSNNIVLTQNAPGLVVRIDDRGVPRFTFPTGFSPDDVNSYVGVSLAYRPSENDIDESQVKFDATYELDWGPITDIKVGFQLRDYRSVLYGGGGRIISTGNLLNSAADDITILTANINQNVTFDPLRPSGVPVPSAPSVQTPINIDSFQGEVTRARLTEIINAGAGRSPGTFFDGYSDIDAIQESWFSPIYASIAPFFDTSNFNHDNLRSALGSDGNLYAQTPIHDIQQSIDAGFVKVSFAQLLWGEEFYGNFGVRVATTTTKATGAYSLSERMPTICAGALPVGQTRAQCIAANPSAAHSNVVLSNSIVSIDSEYTDVLPSFNLAFTPFSDNLVARVSWAKVMARPRPSDLTPNANCVIGSGSRGLATGATPDEDDCTAGNPELEPYRATQRDFSIEYYPNKDTQLSAAFFRKDIDTFILDAQLVTRELFNDGVLYDVRQKINGRGAVTEGYELAARTAFTFLPGLFSGLGADVNFTHTTASNLTLTSPLDGTLLPFPGLSENSYNVNLWYAYGPVNARLAYNYRDPYYTGTSDVSRNPVFREETGYLDARFQYKVSPNLTMFVEGKNLTKQAERAYGGDVARLTELAWPGQRFFVGVTYRN